MLGPIFARAQVAIASVASSKNLSIVVDKQIVIVGGQDITGAVRDLLTGVGEPVPPVNTPPPSTVGYVDQQQIDAVPSIKAAADDFAKFKAAQDQAAAAKFKSAKTQAERDAIMKDYQKTLDDKQNQTLKPLVDKTHGGNGERGPKARVDFGHRSRQRDLRRHGHHGRRDQRVEITCDASSRSIACGTLAACAHGAVYAARGAPAGGRVGYVRMDDLVKKHPLFGQLAQYDANIQALNLSSLVPQVLAQSPRLAAEEARLQAQLASRRQAHRRAAGREGQELPGPRERGDRRRHARGRRAPAVRASAAIQSQMEGTARAQAAGAGAQAQRDFDTYRKQLEAQDMAQVERRAANARSARRPHAIAPRSTSSMPRSRR